MSFRRILKRSVGVAAQRSGAIRLVQRLNRHGVRILMYHRFPLQDGHTFEQHCRLLAANYRVISLAEAVLRLEQKAPVPNAAVITVDDGYSDMYEIAFPILRRHGLPATLFVTTGFLNRTCWMPGDRVRYHFAHTRSPSVRVTDDQGEVHLFRTSENGAAQGLKALLKRVPGSTRSKILSGLEGGDAPADAILSRAEYRPCTWDQVREMADAGISIGAHTVTHPILSRIETEEEAYREIVESKVCLERQIQRDVDVFAYPNGMPEDIDRVSVGYVRKHFKGAVTASLGLNDPGVDVFQLRRLGCYAGMPVPQLARMLAGPLRPSRVAASADGGPAR